MVVTRTLRVAGLLSPLLIGTGARGDYIGITWETDAFALNGVTLLTDLPGYAGQSVYNIFAQFSSPTDQAIGVVGTPTHPFSVTRCDEDEPEGFFNVPASQGGADTPPSSFFAGLAPALNWDSFFTIGTKVSDPLGTPGNPQLIIAPGTPGPPDSEAWGGGLAGINMAWTVPAINEFGQPPPLTLAGAEGKVLLMRLTTDQFTCLDGEFGLLVIQDGIGGEYSGSFHTFLIPAPGVLPLLALVAVAGRWRVRRRPQHPAQPGGDAAAAPIPSRIRCE